MTTKNLAGGKYMKHKKGYALFIAMVLMTIIGVVVTGSLTVNAATTMEKKMYTLENPTWLRAEGFS